MPFLSDDQIQTLVNRAVKKALKGNPAAANQAAVNECPSYQDMRSGPLGSPQDSGQVGDVGMVGKNPLPSQQRRNERCANAAATVTARKT